MKLLLHFLLLGVWLMLLSGCASNPSLVTQKAPRELTQWVDKQLVPYAVKQLSQHPKFKGQPFLVVSLRGDDVQPAIDDLTYYIRDRLMEALLKTPGVNPLWRPATRPWQHHRHLTDLSCGEFNQVHYYIGVDVHPSPLDQAMEVSVRALDVRGNSWVSGFHQSWHGRLNSAQREALTRRHKDEYLRGLRPLPFTAHQPDLLASYLAHNVSCLLRHHQTTEEIIIYSKHPTTEPRPYFRTALDLVDNYLGRFREVQVTNASQQANVILESQVYYLHDHLYQVWVTLRGAQDSRHLAGTETEAYVRLPGMPITPRQATAPSTREGGIPLTYPPPSTALSSISPGQSEPTQNETFIHSLRLLNTKNHLDCSTARRQLESSRNARGEEQPPSRPCPRIEVSVNRAVRLLIMGQNSQGQLRWILPSPCEGNQASGIYLKAGETFYYPLPHGKKKLPRKDSHAMPTKGWIYAIALIDKETHRKPPQQGRMMATRLGLCKNNTASSSSWKAYLNNLLAENGQQVEWKRIPFPSCHANYCIQEAHP